MELVFEYCYPAGSSILSELGVEALDLIIVAEGQRTHLPLRGEFSFCVDRIEGGKFRLRVFSTQNIDHMLSREVLLFMRQAERERERQRAEKKQQYEMLRREKKDNMDAKLRAYLLEFVRLEPGFSMSYYERNRCPGREPVGSQDRKERMMRLLLQEGKLVRVKLSQARGRQTHAVYLPENVPAGSAVN